MKTRTRGLTIAGLLLGLAALAQAGGPKHRKGKRPRKAKPAPTKRFKHAWRQRARSCKTKSKDRAVSLELFVTSSGAPLPRQQAPDEAPLLVLAPAPRPLDGSGNDPSVPDEGKAGAQLLRALTPAYADGVNQPAGPARPSPRAISNAVHAQRGSRLNHRRASDFLWVWGQFLDHDLSLSPEHHPVEAFPIPVPTGDPWFDPTGSGQRTIPLSRSRYAVGVTPRQQLNLLTAWIDGSNVYGSDAGRAGVLRANDGTGRLRTSPGDLLPRNTTHLENAPTPHDPSLFLAGDVRANEHVALTSMHTLFVREHNRLVGLLRARFPQATGDDLYQAARRIVTAELQAITYQEFLPILLGPQGLAPYAGYQQQKQVGILNVFSTAAFRFGHSLLSPRLDRLDAQLAPIAAGPLRLQDGFFQPSRLNDGGIEPILRGAAHQVCQELDPLLTDGVRNFLFGPPGSGGLDLASLNLQRGRDHGLPGYNAARRQLGLAPRADLAGITSDPRRAARLASAYSDVEQVDLWTGALSEDPLPGALVGELLGLLIKRQFELLRDGDRFHYEHAFSGAALTALRQTRLIDVIRRNTAIDQELPEDVFTGRLLPHTPNDLTIRAVTANGETAERFQGFVVVSSSDGAAPLDGLVVELTAADRGQLRLQDVALFPTLGPVTLTATTLGRRPIAGQLTVQVELQDPVVATPPPLTIEPDGGLSLTGLAYPGATVELVVDSGTGPVVLATTTADASGAYRFDVALPAGTHALTIHTTHPTTGAAYASDGYTTTVLPKRPQRLIAAFEEAFAKGGWRTRTIDLPATSGKWFLSAVRSRRSVHARIELNGEELVDLRSWLVGQRRLRLPVAVQGQNQLRVRVSGKGSVEVRLDGVVPELDLPSGVGRRVAKLTPFAAEVAGGVPARTEAFTVALPASPEGLFTLAVANGATPPLAARVDWNGQRVLAPLGLLFQGSRLLPLDAQASNALEAKVLGSPASRLALRFEAYLVDEQPPQITIAPPEDAVVQPDDLVVVTVSDARSGVDANWTRIELNGADVTTQFVRSGDRFEARAGDLPLLPVNTLTVVARDLACNTTQAERHFRTQANGPTVVHPAALQVECTGNGTTVRYTVRATDLSDPNPLVVCAPPSGASFPLGTTTVTCVATTADGRSTTISFPVTVADTTPPALGAPAPALRAAEALPGAATAAVALADVNGDGALDLLAAEPATPSVALRLGDGAGAFGAPQALTAGADPRALLLADLDADGRPDLIVANTAASTITRLLNGPSGFGAPASTPSGAGPVALAAADFDADGSLDLAIACQGASGVTVLFGDGAGGFPRQATLATAGPPTSLLALDHDADGRADLAVGGSTGVWLYLGLGAGGFEPARSVALTGVRGVASADLDGDGWLDLAAVHVGGVSVLRNDGQRGLTAGAPLPLPAPAASVLALDLEGDGDADLVTGASLLLNQGGASFAAPAPLGWTDPAGLGAGDLDGDGRPDLAAALASGLSLRRGDPAQADLTAEATGVAGAAVSYATPPARDRCDPSPAVACAPVSGSSFPLGTTEVTCTATDASGNTARLRFAVVVRDTTPPVITPPADLVIEQTLTNGAVVTYALPAVTDAVDPAPVVACAPLSGTVFAPGATTVTCTATDASGNSAQASFTVTVQDTVAPGLSLTPADGATLPSQAQYALSATYSDGGSGVATASFRATLDGTDVSSSFSVGAASASASLAIGAGAHTFTVTIADAAGNQTTVTHGFVVEAPPADTTPPTLTVDAPGAGACVGTTALVQLSFADTGSGIDTASLSITLNGADVTASFSAGAGSAQASVSGLSPTQGSNTLAASVRDQAGNQTTASVSFEFDSAGPTITLTPADGASLPQAASQTLTASYTDAGCGVDAATVSATLDGNPLTITATASQATASVANLAPGSHVFSVTVSDEVGNSTTQSATFTVLSQQAARLEVTISAASPTAVPALVGHDLTVRALTSNGQLATGFVGFVLVNSSDGRQPLDGTLLEFTAADQGAQTLSGVAFFQTLGTVVITASSVGGEISGSLALNVVLAAPVIYPQPPATIGADGALTVTGLAAPSQSVELLDGPDVLASATAGLNGEFAFSVVLTTGAHSLSVRAAGQTSAPVSVTVPAPTTTALTASPASVSLARGQTQALQISRLLSTGATEEVTAQASYQSDAPAVAAVDAAGVLAGINPGSATITATFDGVATTIPVTVTVPTLQATSPQNGDDDVALTRETILRFSAPLDAPSITAQAVFAEYAGATLPARLHVSPDNATVTLFYANPLPASARVRVTVNGDLLTSSGQPVDADGDGAPGGTKQIDFDTLSLTVVPGTAVCGRVFASELGDGGVSTPLQGVKITVDGAATTLFTTTDAFGNFILSPAPAGQFFVHVDGRPVTQLGGNPIPTGAYFPFVGKSWTSVPGEKITIGDVFLPLVAPGTLQTVSQTSDTTITFPPATLTQYPQLAGVELTVPADSLYSDDGTRGGQVGIAPVAPDRLPGQLPDNLNFSLVFTVQTDGPTNFDTPVAVRFPNTDNLPPGTKTALWSFNHV